MCEGAGEWLQIRAFWNARFWTFWKVSLLHTLLQSSPYSSPSCTYRRKRHQWYAFSPPTSIRIFVLIPKDSYCFFSPGVIPTSSIFELHCSSWSYLLYLRDKIVFSCRGGQRSYSKIELWMLFALLRGAQCGMRQKSAGSMQTAALQPLKMKSEVRGWTSNSQLRACESDMLHKMMYSKASQQSSFLDLARLFRFHLGWQSLN